MTSLLKIMKHAAIIMLLLFTINNSYSQTDSISGVKLIDYYLVNKQTRKADSVLSVQLKYFKNNAKLDSLFAYPYYVGKLKGINATELFTTQLINGETSYKTKYKAAINLADFYDEINENQKSLQVTKKALGFALKSKTTTPEDLGKVRYNIGATYLNLGEIEKAKTYFIRGLNDYASYKNTNPKALSDANNAVGATMWMSAKLDSAKYYYTNAIKALETAKGDSIENTYLATIIKSNISLLEHSQGQLSEAINTQKSVISNYQLVTDNILEENIKVKAQRYQLRAISNLSIFYNEYGDFSKANNVLGYALQKSKQILDQGDPEIGSIEIQLGQSELSLKNYNKAIEHLSQGLDNFENSSGGNTYWQAAAHHALAEAYNGTKNSVQSKIHYDQAETLFKNTLGNNYDKEFLAFLNNKALFLAKNMEPNKALKTSRIAYDYLIQNNQENSFLILKHLQNLAEVFYINQDYANAKKWAKKGNALITKNIKTSKTVLDSIKLSFNKPSLILLEAKAAYKLLPENTPENLLDLTKKLNEGLVILENRKTTVFNQEDINILINDYKRLTDFSKELHLILFETTGNHMYLDKCIELHESSIYNRIRSRLNLKNDIAFANLTPEIIEREKSLKRTISSSLDRSSSMDDFFKVQEQWNTFKDTLKKDYPKYYKMRYATIEQSLERLQSKIPKNSTVVRYLFIASDLYAFVVSKTYKNLYKLDPKNLNEKIHALGENQYNVAEMSNIYHDLYMQLWQPFEADITSENIIIVPDNELFNLSFETLTPNPINSFKELASNSLIAKHTISYNYSLLLLDKDTKTLGFKNDFIAFAPEFNAKMKRNYQIAISDSIAIDKTYLNLLPQPFSVDLAKDFSRLFNGKSFLNENATKQIFTSEANEHKIIHIGTHAESNNVSPELSRLIFAKNSENEDNSLYTFEIYNENLNTQLAILTACETGKPTYQSGEGMISLAHAFNYAGSQSILTSLWKIDEQSSTEILNYFYENLAKGDSKNKALKNAKLQYLGSAQGRTIAPQYWAGLVLIGDTSPIDLSARQSIIYWLLGAILFVFLSVIMLRERH